MTILGTGIYCALWPFAFGLPLGGRSEHAEACERSSNDGASQKRTAPSGRPIFDRLLRCSSFTWLATLTRRVLQPAKSGPPKSARYARAKYKVLISTRSFGKADPEPLKLLKDAGLDVAMNPYGRKLTPQESAELLKGAAGLIAGTETLNDGVFAKTPELRVISRVGVGLDNVDMEAAKKRGIAVFSTPDAPTLAVAEMAVGSMLALLRHIPVSDGAVRRGEWAGPMGRQLSGKTVGIIGFGRIGKTVARLLRSFSVKVLAYDPVKSPEDASALGVEHVEIEPLLSSCDIVTLHLALTPQSKGFLSADRLGRMKKGSLLVNTARGGIIDETALAELLKAGRIAGAALDAFAEEPYKGPLCSMPQVIVTPHIASSTEECRRQMELEAAQNLLRGLEAAK